MLRKMMKLKLFLSSSKSKIKRRIRLTITTIKIFSLSISKTLKANFKIIYRLIITTTRIKKKISLLISYLNKTFKTMINKLPLILKIT